MANAETTTQSDRERLRDERKLSLIPDADQGSSIDFLPPGTYGFTYSPCTEGVPVFAKQTFQAFEVHKLYSGAVHLLGYMGGGDAKAFESATQATELKLYPEPFADANILVSVPLSRILKAKPASREGGNWVGFLCQPTGS